MQVRVIIVAATAMLTLCAAAGGKTKVACVGDSITYGLGLADRAAESYPARLQELLDRSFPGRYEVRNFGNSGRGVYLDSMRGSEKRGYRWMKEHAAALEWRPDVVICNLGINDCGEYINEYTGGRRRGQFADDYCALLGDYKAQGAKRLYIWTKLSPLAEGQKFYRSPEPFLMQRDLEAVASRTGATGIDMQEPLREGMDVIFAKDKIHPDAEGARIIAEATFKALAGGAGGQYVNKTESAIRITHLPTGLVVTCQDEKSQIKNKEKAMKVLKSKLYDYYRSAADKEYAEKRKAQVGSGDRSERIRTYNYPQGRVTDHRIGLTLYNLEQFLDGDMLEMLDALALNEQNELLKGSQD